MLLDTPTDAREKLIVELVQALKRAGAHPVGTPLQTEITARVIGALRSALKGRDDELCFEATDQGVLVNGTLHTFEAPGVAALAGHMINRLTNQVILPKQVPIDDLWRFLVIFGGSPERLRASGGPVTSLADAGVFTVRIEEEPVTVELRLPKREMSDSDIDILTGSSGWNEIPEVEAFGVGDETMTREISTASTDDPVAKVEEITPWQAVSDEIERADMGENTAQAIQGGDTAKSGLADGETEGPPSVLEKITRRVIRAKRPDGPDEAAVQLLIAWRKLFQFESESGELPARPIAATLQRLDPLVRFMILARLARTSEGRAISGLMPDGVICDAVTQALQSIPDSSPNIKSVLRTVRPRGAILIRLLNRINQGLEGHTEDLATWETIREELASEPTNP